MRIGAHISIARGPERCVRLALERGCESIQIFSSNPRGWALGRSAASSDEVLARLLDEHGLRPVLLHAPYLVNIAARDPDVYARSAASLVHAAERARRLDGMVVVHAGRDRAGPRTEAVRRAAAALLTTLKLVPQATVLVEPTAGGRGSVASTPDELAELLACVDDGRVGVCLDTCHVHAAGDDLSSERGVKRWLGRIEREVGIERVRALHLNDARDPAGSCRDRHWHLGRGTIGETGFRTLLRDRRLVHLPAILETPGTAEDDRRNLDAARAYAGRDRRRSSTPKAAARSSNRPRK